MIFCRYIDNGPISSKLLSFTGEKEVLLMNFERNEMAENTRNIFLFPPSILRLSYGLRIPSFLQTLLEVCLFALFLRALTDVCQWI